jgi:hypothetical protein
MAKEKYVVVAVEQIHFLFLLQMDKLSRLDRRRLEVLPKVAAIL